jgi:UDP-3-O-[3-hydroxymyristoyl] glucosamine N-acyltransferase
MGEGSSIGAFCVIGTDVKLGKNVIIYPQCYIGDGVSIGDDSIVYPHVTVLERCIIGKRCTLHPGVVIGADGFGFHFVAGKFVKAPQRGTVKLDDDVEIGANTTVDRARFDVTHIKSGSKLDNLVMVGHNVQVGSHCVIAGQAGISGSVVLKDYVQLGGNVGIADHITIGMGAKIAAKAGVMRDVDPGMKMAGAPADDGKAFMRSQIALRKLPQAIDDLKELQKMVMRLATKVGLPKPGEDAGFDKVDDTEEPEPGTVTRFLRNRPAPEPESPPEG